MARLGRAGFLAIAVIFHLVYIYSIFDIYFVSPIVSGMREHRVEGRKAPAQRLVLFVGDGLRADKAFQSFPDPSPDPGDTDAHVPRPLAPFLRSRVLEHGTFGVSHTRVPTESRPGHVALIAGLYEDVSAVTTGWKLNPVNFDSVFNRSRHTWSWGSPDILPMFKEGAVPGRIYADTYGAEAEDFTSDATHLDLWVFDRVKALFAEARTNASLDAELRQDKNVFFLHLLGLDTTGHGYRPYSKEYLHNIKVVDQGVREITELIEEFYADEQTAFVFTADHGMSDWGSHGDGHPDNTRTPLIAWGSGVAAPLKTESGIAPGHEDGLSADWGLSHVVRHDVAQADVAALMAYLVGLAFPVNSVGELPLAYLDAEPAAKAEALLVNAREILEMYRVKEQDRKATALRYRAFPELGDEQHDVAHRVASIRLAIESGRADEAIAQSEELIKLGLQGLRYLQTYDWLFLRALVTMGYLGWMAFAITTVVDLHVMHGTTETARTRGSIMVFSAVGVALFSALWVQKSSWTYYAYAFFPVMFWEEVFARRAALAKGKDVLFAHVKGGKDFLMLAVKVVAYLGLLEALVQSYFHREVFTLCYILATLWPVFYGMGFVRQHAVLIATWWLSCSMMSVFTLLSAVKSESLTLILLGGFLMFAVGVVYLVFEDTILAQSSSNKAATPSTKQDGLSRTILGTQVGLIALAMFVTRSSVKSLQAREGLPLGTQIVGWVVLVSSLAVPFLHSLQPNNHYIHRLVVIFLSFAPIFVILTISYEGLFYFAFCTTLVTWVRLEHHIFRFTSSQQRSAMPASKSANGAPATPAAQPHSYRALTLGDARISLFSLFLLQSAFFSTGNIASISSFSLDAVYRLIPVFDPFSQGALLLLKLLIPFAVISANLGILNRRLGVAPSALFMIVMAVADVLTVRFFWVVRDEGSWLDIGTSISHFCISSLLGVFVAALEGGSGLLVGNVEVDDDGRGEVSKAEQREKVDGGETNGAVRKSG
ncbi:putative phosphatidylinositolglycan class N [Saccharata proteae CBS 121410]|uniref:GPI ethanolamine phosphate transferase 1 n=1 Tax=Saccharata proteae CBS 121410 TaxID=1314787 RepID=A0A9P4M3N6_9PEZI|nr:putative phosphatidylinositolglycan class N [Saccharata proteae CBS 121410]